MKLHAVDGFDEIEEGLGAFGLVRNFTSGAVSWFQYGVIFKFFKDVTIETETFGGVDIDVVEKRDKIAQCGGFDLVDVERLWNRLYFGLFHGWFGRRGGSWLWGWGRSNFRNIEFWHIHGVEGGDAFGGRCDNCHFRLGEGTVWLAEFASVAFWYRRRSSDRVRENRVDIGRVSNIIDCFL